jgi:hypothetical protein
MIMQQALTSIGLAVLHKAVKLQMELLYLYYHINFRQ